MTRIPIRRVLISVYDKRGLLELGQALASAGVDIVSTGGTAAQLIKAGLAVTEVSDLTGFPESFDGRVKTLHPAVHAGLLADRRKVEHQKALDELQISSFDLVVSNLYPLYDAASSEAGEDEVIEQIDIGGPAMIRSAAKNHANVAVVVNPDDYSKVATALTTGGFTNTERRELACSAFAHTAAYDTAIANWFGRGQEFPEYHGVALRRLGVLRYGENPHQKGALYADRFAPPGLAQAELLHGEDMSYNNYVDTDAAWRAANDFVEPCVAIVKHANPCGIAIDVDIAESYRRAHECDPISAFGGVIAANTQISTAMAERVITVLTHVIVAPSYSDGALDVLRTKKSLRVLRCAHTSRAPQEIRQVSGGMLVQTADQLNTPGDDPRNWKLVAGAAVDDNVLRDLHFAWRAARSVKSNAILLARGGASVGVGMGQVNRLDSARLAIARAGERAHGSVAASDAFFPFPDGLEVLLDAGVAAVVQPGGSVRDEEVIAVADRAGVPLYVTGTRHFFH